MILSHFPPQTLSVCLDFLWVFFFFFHFNSLVDVEDSKMSCKGGFCGASMKKAFRVGNAVEKEFSDVQMQVGAAAYLCAAQFVS